MNGQFLESARLAQHKLRGILPVTRLCESEALSDVANSHVYLKLETDLPTGSFKPRGALHALGANLMRREIREVIASSVGNHGAAVAFAARHWRIPATIFLPENPVAVKLARIVSLGARTVQAGSEDLRVAFEQAAEYARSPGVYFLNDATDPDVPAGAATTAIEIIEQLPSVSTIVVPIGDTALIRGVAGVAKTLLPKTRVIGVLAEKAPAYFLSWRAGQAISTERCDTVADGLATRVPEAANVQAIRELVDDIVLVTDDELLAAIRHLAEVEHLIVEPAGAAATAAVLQQKVQCGQNTVVLITGANIDPRVLRAALSRATR